MLLQAGLLQADEVGPAHQGGDEHAFPEGAEIAGDDAGEDRERCAAFARGGDDFMDVLAVRAGEDFGEFGNQHGGERAAANDRGQLPPQILSAIVSRPSDHDRSRIKQPAHAKRGD